MTDSDKKFSYLEVEAALCVWECLLEWTSLAGGDVHGAAINDDEDSVHTAWIAERERVGSVALRHQSMALGEWCLEVYDLCTKRDKNIFDGYAYDWEVIPAMLSHVAPDDMPDPANIARLVFDEFKRRAHNDFGPQNRTTRPMGTVPQ